jgi:hypothetical protein
MTRVRIFSVVLGMCLALAGVLLDNRLLVWAAMVVLATALGLRWWQKRRKH